MAEKINEIVDISITRDTQVIDIVNFNKVLLLTDEKPFFDRVRTYYSLNAMQTDGIVESGVTYKAAQAFFSQNPRPTQIVLGHRNRTGSEITLAESAIKNSTSYSITVLPKDGTVGTAQTVSFTSSATAEADKPAAIDAIFTGLKVAIDANSLITDVVTVVQSGTLATTKFSLTQVATKEYAITGVTNGLLEVASTGMETAATAIAAVRAVNDNWYALGATTRDAADQLTIAALIETTKKFYFCGTQHADSLNVVNDTTAATADDIAGKVFEVKYDRTGVVYSATADSTYLDMAIMGKKMLSIPGATTWKFTTVAGVVPDNLTATQSLTIRNKNGNTYEGISGVNIAREGTVGSGEFIDIIHGADELHARLQTEIFRALVTTANRGSKIPLTEQGIGVLKGIVTTEIKRSQQQGFISPFLTRTSDAGRPETIKAFEVKAGLVQDMTANDRALRNSPTISFVAALAGAVHKVIVRGSLYV